MSEQGKDIEEVKAQKELTSLFIGDKDGIPVLLSSGLTVYVTRTKNINNIRAWHKFIGMDKNSDDFDRLKMASEGAELVRENNPESYGKKIKEYAGIKSRLISEFFTKVENIESLCKGLSYIILNSEEAILKDEFYFGKIKKPKKKRLWYKLYTECDNKDLSDIFQAWVTKNDVAVFFSIMELILSQNPLKEQSQAGQ